jgi:hypothetical protein
MVERARREHVTKLAWWMRIVGAFYVLQAVVIIVARAPIRTFGPEGTLEQADAGDPIAGFVVDTWTTFGVEVGVIGVALLIAARSPERARILAWTVIAIEAVRGIGTDVVQIARGIEVAGYLAWIPIHTVVIVTGVLVLRDAATSGPDAKPATPT